MTQSPIRRVLSTLSSHGVRFLLMGGPACILYGAAEFSRDTDIVILADAGNLARLEAALAGLHAERIAVPPLDLRYLAKGHAVHFRCRRADVSGMRIDVMAVMRGVDPFATLWERRSTIAMADGGVLDLLSLPDLVRAKKTQRDKDWPMLRRLVEAHFAEHEASPAPEHVEFWFREARTASLLIDLAMRYPEEISRAEASRPLLGHARRGDEAGLEDALDEEARAERARDREHWRPLVRELEEVRHDETLRLHRERTAASGSPDPEGCA